MGKHTYTHAHPPNSFVIFARRDGSCSVSSMEDANAGAVGRMVFFRLDSLSVVGGRYRCAEARARAGASL